MVTVTAYTVWVRHGLDGVLDEMENGQPVVAKSARGGVLVPASLSVCCERVQSAAYVSVTFCLHMFACMVLRLTVSD